MSAEVREENAQLHRSEVRKAVVNKYHVFPYDKTMIILPRQARDKSRRKAETGWWFRTVQ